MTQQSIETIKRDYPYQYFGAHPSQNETIFRVYAPRATRVSLLREGNGWDCFAETMTKNDEGVWEITIPENLTWKEYKYYIENHSDYLGQPYEMSRIDPFSPQLAVTW